MSAPPSHLEIDGPITIEVMWGNDYPHHDSIWPQSMRILDELMTGVPANEVKQMCLDTVCELYSVDRSKLPTV